MFFGREMDGVDSVWFCRSALNLIPPSTCLFSLLSAMAARRAMTPLPVLASRIMSSPSFLSSSCGASISPSVPVLCGRGDRKTKKGKRFRGTYGNARPKKDKKIERIKERIEVPSSTPWPLPFKLI